MKDYYAILGVVPSAEDIVIKAAYKALAQRYHPDRNPGSAEAARKMQELNEAYQVLADPVKRKAYDQERGTKEQDFDDWSREEEAEEARSSADPFEKDWQIAIKYYPDLEEINRRLMKTSRMLAFTFRATLIETKDFSNRDSYANFIETEFLKNYFGDNSKLIDFARQVIALGNRKAAKALNDAIRVIGSSSPEIIIEKICRDYAVVTDEMIKSHELPYINKTRRQLLFLSLALSLSALVASFIGVAQTGIGIVEALFISSALVACLAVSP